MPDVSVIVASYNAGRTLEAALASIFAQTVRGLDIIVVDDGSTDDTPSRLAPWSGKISSVRQERRGPAHARNRGFERSTGDLVAFLDPADLWLPRKLERQLAHLENETSAALSYTFSIGHSAPRRALAESTDGVTPDQAGQRATKQFGAVFHDDVVRTSTVVVRRRVFEELGGFDERRELEPFEAWHMWVRVAARYPIACLPLALAVHRPEVRTAAESERDFRRREFVTGQVGPLFGATCERHDANPH